MGTTILIADDDCAFVALLRARLVHAAYTVLTVHEGVRAMEVAQRERPDCILLDLNMPVGSGELVLARLRAHHATAAIPVIVISGVDSADVEHTVLAAGASHYLQKPFPSEQLLAMIDALVRP